MHLDLPEKTIPIIPLLAEPGLLRKFSEIRTSLSALLHLLMEMMDVDPSANLGALSTMHLALMLNLTHSFPTLALTIASLTSKTPLMDPTECGTIPLETPFHAESTTLMPSKLWELLTASTLDLLVMMFVETGAKCTVTLSCGIARVLMLNIPTLPLA